MIIQQKEKPLYFYGGLIAIIIGGFFLFYLMDYKSESGDFLTVMGKLFSLTCVILGIISALRYDKYRQPKDVSLEIDENNLIYNDKEYPLSESYLTTNYTKSSDFFRTTLWLEKDDTATEIFKNVVLNLEEMANFLDIIKPYRKSNVCLAKKSRGKITLFNGGFIFEKREILYTEIEKFETIIVKTDGRDYLDIEVVLKNGEKIDKRLIDGNHEYAQALYAEILFKDKELSKIDFNCPKKSIWWIVVVVFNLAIVGFITYNNQFVEVGISVILLITTVYATFRKTSVIALCQEIQKIYEQEHADDNQ